jgi:hypothetical protein
VERGREGEEGGEGGRGRRGRRERGRERERRKGEEGERGRERGVGKSLGIQFRVRREGGKEDVKAEERMKRRERESLNQYYQVTHNKLCHRGQVK